MAKAAKPSLAAAEPTMEWNVDATSGKPIVNDNGTWRFATDEEVSARDKAAVAAAPPVPGPQPVMPAPGPAPAGFAFVSGTNEQIPIPGQEQIMDGKHKEGEITLTSPTGAAAPAANDQVATMQRQINDRIAERDALQRDNDRLRTVNGQVIEQNKMLAKQLEAYQTNGVDSMGIAKTPGM